MDLAKVLVELRAELENLDAAILSLERLKQEGHRRRGRPPKWMKEAKEGPPKRRAGGKAGAKRN